MSRQRRQRGRVSWIATLTVWLRQHLDAASRAFGYFRQTPFASFLTIVAIAVALAVPASLYVAVNGFSGIFDFNEPRQINAFMQLDIDGQRLSEIAEQFRLRPDVGSVDTISRAQSLEDFRQSTGMADALALLKKNPLPAVLVIHPASNLLDIDALRALSEEIAASPAVESVSLDADWLAKLFALGRSLKILTWLVGLALSAMVILLIHYSLGSEIIKRKEEIQVVKLVGGSLGYLQRPFLYYAVFLGLTGALLALVVLKLVFGHIAPEIEGLSVTSDQVIDLALTPVFSLSLVVLAVCLSAAAAILTIHFLLRDIEPG